MKQKRISIHVPTKEYTEKVDLKYNEKTYRIYQREHKINTVVGVKSEIHIFRRNKEVNIIFISVWSNNLIVG